ncbi:MAG: YcaO-like family protein [Dehalococcoidia bacterium]|nr:YcaO-like family protein [Dehalococcoidia bacterium]
MIATAGAVAERQELEQAVARFASLVDARTGLISRVDSIALTARDPQLHLVYAEPCDTTSMAGLAAANAGAAASPDPRRAFVRACGESIERYCGAFFDFGAMRLATEEELNAAGETFEPIGSFYPFAEEQYAQDGFPFERPTVRPTRWLPAIRWREDARDLGAAGGETVLVPASAVYVPYLFDRDVEPFTHMPISTGLAAGPTRARAITKGIFEILERDAFMVSWHAQLSGDVIDPASCAGRHPLVDEMLAYAGQTSRWHINGLRTDVDVPIVSAALVDEDDPPMTSFGIAAHTDASHALLLAMEEAMLTRVLLNRSPQTLVPWTDMTTVNDLRAHMLAHASTPSLREALAFLDAGPVRAFGDYVASFDRAPASLHGALAAAGFEALWVDVTTPDVAEVGLHVVRSLVPGMQPLDNDHTHRYLGGHRVRDVARRFGRDIHDASAYHAAPHPFP